MATSNYEQQEVEPRKARGKKINYDELVNIAPKLKEQEQKQIAKRCVHTAMLDWESSKEFRNKRDKWLKLFMGKMPEKSASYGNVANIHLPLIARAVILLHARLFGQQFPVTGDIYNAYPSHPEDIDRARRVTRHMNFQLRKEIVEYVPAHDRGMMQLLLYGSAFSMWDYDSEQQRPTFEFLRVDDIILPYRTLSDRVDLADMPRITRRRFRYRASLRRLHAQGLYQEIPEMYEAKNLDDDGVPKTSNYDLSEDTLESGSNITKLIDDIQGVEQNSEDPNAPRVLLEQDTFMVLPGDTEERAVTIVVDVRTEQLLQLILREKEDPMDRARFEREMAAFEEEAQSALMDFEQATMEWQATAADIQSSGQDISSLPPPQQPPEPQEPPRSVRKVPFNRYTHHRCMPNPEGVYGLGMGFLLEGDNVAADAWASAITSLAKLNVTPTVVYSRQAAGPRGDVPLVLGESTEINVPPEQVKNAFYQFQFPPPDPSAFKLLEMFQTNAEQLGAPEIFSGEVSDRETATTTEIRAEMAMQTIKTIAQRYNLSRTNDVRILAYLNSQTLNDKEYFYIVENDNIQMEEINRGDYHDDFQVGFTADLTFSKTMQGRQARQVIEMLSQVPPEALMLKPEETAMMWRSAVATSMRAIGADKEASILENAEPPAPPPPPEGMPLDAATDETPFPDEGAPPPAGGPPGSDLGAAPPGPPPGVSGDAGNVGPPGPPL